MEIECVYISIYYIHVTCNYIRVCICSFNLFCIFLCVSAGLAESVQAFRIAPKSEASNQNYLDHIAQA